MHMLFIMRHGERADEGPLEEYKKIENHVDPHLTDLGKVQAYEAAETIKAQVHAAYKSKDLDSSKVRYLVVSSPFLRCI